MVSLMTVQKKQSSGSDGEETEDTTDEKTTTSDVTNSIEREGGSGGDAPEIRGLTDDASYNSTQKMRDKEVSEIQYASIPKIDLDKVIVDYQTVSKVFNKTYSNPSGNSEQRYIDSNLEELNTHFKDNKKIISYMVKEFEMKLQTNMQGHQFQKLELWIWVGYILTSSMMTYSEK